MEISKIFSFKIFLLQIRKDFEKAKEILKDAVRNDPVSIYVKYLLHY